MSEHVVFVLPPADDPSRRSMEALMGLVASAMPESRIEGLDRVPMAGPGPGSPSVVVSTSPVRLPHGTLGVCIPMSWSLPWEPVGAHVFGVAHVDLARELVARGLPEDRVEVVGVPIRREDRDRATALANLNLTPGPKQIVGVMLEGLPEETLDQMLFQFTLLEPPALLLFFAGRDQRLASVLRRRVPVLGLDARLLVDESRVPDLLAVSTVAVTSSAGVPSAQALAAGVPALVVPASGAGGLDAARFLASHGAARLVSEIRTLAADLDVLRHDPETRSLLRERAATMLPREPMAKALSFVQGAVAAREELLVEPAASPGAARGGQGSVLEDLGGSPDPGAHFHGMGADTEARSLLEIITAEKATRARFEDVNAELAKWKKRVGLAAEAGDDELRDMAIREVRRLEAEKTRLERELERLAGMRVRAARVGTPAVGRGQDYEERFRKLELDAQLRELKDRMRSA